MSEQRALNAFLRQYLEDQVQSRRRGLAEYQALFPGHDAVIAEQFARYEDDARASRDPAPSDRIGRFCILRELGRGGQGVVYLAEDDQLHRKVAVKVLTGLGSLSPDRVTRFLREAEVASRLDHPGIATVYEMGMDGGVPFLAMRYVEGESIACLISRAQGEQPPEILSFEDGERAPRKAPDPAPPRSGSGPHTSKEIAVVLALFEDIARTLHFAHEAGIVHRDIKPGNIIVTKEGKPVILDFGLAQETEGEQPTLTATGDIMGTPAYLSPEQIAAKRIKLDRRTDVYSLGVSLYECLTLTRPFDAPTRESLYQAILTKSPPNPRGLNPSVPKDLKVVLEVALEKDRDRRYATALAFADDLRRIRASEPIAAKPVGPLGRFVRFAKRRPAAAALIGVLAIAIPTITGLGGFLAANWDELEEQKRRSVEEQVEGQLDCGYLDLAEAMPERAIAAFDRAISLRPQSIEAIAGKAMALLRMNRATEALNVIDLQSPDLESGGALQRLRADAFEKLGRHADAESVRKQLAAPGSSLESFLAGQADAERGDASHKRDLESYRRAIVALSDAVARSRSARLLYHGALLRAAANAKDAGVVRRLVPAMTLLWPDSAAAWHQAGYAWSGLADWPAAIEASRRALAIEPKLVRALNNLALGLEKSGLADEAIETYRLGLQIDPDLANLRIGLGAALAKKGLRDDAIAEYAHAAVLEPQNPMAHHNLGAELQKKGLLDEAISKFRRASELDPKYAGAFNGLASALRQKGALDDAITACRRAIDADPGYFMAWINLGWSHRLKGDHEEAIAAFRRAAEIDPASAIPHDHLGLTLRKTGRHEEAAGAFRRATELDPDFALARTHLGLSLKDLGRIEDAIAEWRRAIPLDRKEPTVRQHLARALRDTNRMQEAIAEYRVAIELDPKAASNHSGLGFAFHTRHQYGEAIAEYRRAIELGSDTAWIRHSLGKVLQASGQLDQARVEFRRALDIDPKYEPAQAGLDDIESLLVDYERWVDRIVAGAAPPDDAETALHVAWVASGRELHALAARLWTVALRMAPELSEVRENHWFDRAARSALIAAAGRGRDAADLAPAQRAELRARGLEWMEIELALWNRWLAEAADPATARKLARWCFERWKEDPELAHVREPAEIAKLPEVEREPWRKHWTDVEARLSALAQ